jgi:hypothetical protein
MRVGFPVLATWKRPLAAMCLLGVLCAGCATGAVGQPGLLGGWTGTSAKDRDIQERARKSREFPDAGPDGI